MCALPGSLPESLCFRGLECRDSKSTSTGHIAIAYAYRLTILTLYVSGQFLEGGANKSEGDTLPHHLWVCASRCPQLLRRRSWRRRLPTRSPPKAERATLHVRRGAGLSQGPTSQIPPWSCFFEDFCVQLYYSPSYFPSSFPTPPQHIHICAHSWE